MKFLLAFFLIGIAALAGCSTTANNVNIRGTNTNTGYVTNSATNVRPALPVNATNISPPSMNSVTGNGANRGSAIPNSANAVSNPSGTRKP